MTLLTKLICFVHQYSYENHMEMYWLHFKSHNWRVHIPSFGGCAICFLTCPPLYTVRLIIKLVKRLRKLNWLYITVISPPQRFASNPFFQKDDAKRYWHFPVCGLISSRAFFLVSKYMHYFYFNIFFSSLQ